VEVIAQWFARMAPAERPRTVTMLSIQTGAFGSDLKDVSRGTAEQEIGAAMRALGFRPKVERADNTRRRVWVTPAALLG
jgi:hypothetical protein